MDQFLRRRIMMGGTSPTPVEYIVFADQTVGAICAENWGDGIGITEAQAAAVPFSTVAERNAFWGKFTNASTITSFDELKYFTNVNRIPASKFSGNTVLTSIALDNIVILENSCFQNCTALSIEIDMPNANLSTSFYSQFRGSGVTKVKNIGNSAELSGYFFCYQCPALTEVHLPATLTKIDRQNFLQCSNLTTVVCLATTPPRATAKNFDTRETTKIYVPYSADHSILDAYKAATGWSDNASQIFELNQDGTIPS